jgi:hypothetical protein
MIMTNNVPNQPNGPHSDRSAQQTPRGVYNPITIEDTGNHQQPSWSRDLEWPYVRMFVALLFAVIFGIAWHRPEFSPLTIIVVAGCLLYRLDSWQRKLATAPLLLAAIRFYLLLPAYSAEMTRQRIPDGDFGIPWIPAFLSVCLFFLPRKESVMLKIVVAESLVLILSSLLPGEGLLGVLAVLNYTLFFVVTIGLLLDLKPGLRGLFSNTTAHAVAPPPARPAA